MPFVYVSTYFGKSGCKYTLKVVPHHKPHKILKFNFPENYINEKPPYPYKISTKLNKAFSSY